MQANPWLITGGVLSALAALLHIGVIAGGPDWYRFFGAGEGMAILAETGLSFLGFGVQPPDVSLGTLIADGTKSATTFPWVFLFPAGVLVLIVLCANLIGDGLRDALDPASANLRPRQQVAKP